MKYINEYLKEKVRVQPLGRVTYVDDEDSAGWSRVAVRIDDVETAIFISHADYAEWLESKLDALKAKNEQKTEEKSEEKPEPRFKVGDWVIAKDDGGTAWLITAIGSNYSDYSMVSSRGSAECVDYSYVDNNYRLWTLQDAKDGDVLECYDDYIFIYNNSCILQAYCYYCIAKGKFCIKDPTHYPEWRMQSVKPADNEQREFFFTKMKEAGYEWDANQKKLKKQDEPKDYNSIDPHFGKPIETEPKDYNSIDPHFGKPIDTKSKFKVGDWIFSPAWGTAHIIGTGVIGVNDSDFLLEYTDGKKEYVPSEYVNSAFDKWNIQNVKDGDVLNGRYGTFIFKGEGYGYCGVLNDNSFIYSTGNNEWTKGLYPATNEQRGFLFKKMKEAGYEWDANQKKLVVRVP